jgi:hypothetical protein
VAEWKAAFVFMERDRGRVHIATGELCDEVRQWTWTFSANTDMREHESIRSVFHPDGDYQSSFMHEEVMQWSFTNGAIGEAGSEIQVCRCARVLAWGRIRCLSVALLTDLAMPIHDPPHHRRGPLTASADL